MWLMLKNFKLIFIFLSYCIYFLIFKKIFLFFVLFLLSVSCYLDPGNLNDIHVCSKTIELEVGQILQYKYLYNSGMLRRR